MFKVIPPGTVYSVDNPEFVGRIPVRTEITVLPADEPKKLGWRIQSYDGAEVFLLTSAGDVIKSPITDQEALKRVCGFRRGEGLGSLRRMSIRFCTWMVHGILARSVSMKTIDIAGPAQGLSISDW
jgi:hypothetical protein